MTRLPGILHAGPTSRVTVRMGPDDAAAVALLLGPGAHRLPDPPAGYVVLASAHPTCAVQVGGRTVAAPCIAWELPA